MNIISILFQRLEEKDHYDELAMMKTRKTKQNNILQRVAFFTYRSKSNPDDWIEPMWSWNEEKGASNERLPFG